MSLEKRCRNCQFFRPKDNLLLDSSSPLDNKLQITAVTSIRGKCKADYVNPTYGLQTQDLDVNSSNLCRAWDPYNKLLFKSK